MDRYLEPWRLLPHPLSDNAQVIACEILVYDIRSQWKCIHICLDNC